MGESCRLCRRTDYISSESVKNYHEGIKISEMVMKVCPIKISDGDELPKTICEECLEISSSAYLLQKVSVESDSFFRSQLTDEKVCLTKEEPKDTSIGEEETIEISDDEHFVDVGASTSESKTKQISTKTVFNPRSILSMSSSSHDRWYRCNFCEAELRPRENMIRHMMKNHDPVAKPFPCQYCVRRFTDKSLLKDHERWNHINEKPSIIFCSTCGASGNHKKGMKYHKADDHDDAFLERRSKIHEYTDLRSVSMKSQDVFMCDLCGVGKNTKDKLERHMNEYHCQYKCSECGQVFKRKQSLLTHLTISHKSNYGCNTCGKNFTSLTIRRLHNLEAHQSKIRALKKSEIQTEIECCVCKKPFCSEKELMDHVPLHRKDFKDIQCKHARFNNAKFDYETFVEHSKRFAQPRTHECSFCQKYFPADQTLLNHVKNHQIMKHRVTCEKCGTKCKSQRHLEIHDRVIHDQERLFICPICGKSLSTESSLNNHIEYVHERRETENHVCEICGRGFPRKKSLQRHLGTHSTERPFVCPIKDCESTFKSNEGLRTHVKRHNGTLVKRFCCTICPFKGITRHRLQVHSFIHTGIKPYECEFCDRAYASKGDLNKHLKKVHVGDALYKCEKCPSAFPYVVELREHMRVHVE